MQAKDRLDIREKPLTAGDRPLLMVDIDGVISLFGVDPSGARATAGSFHSIEGIPHFLSSAAAAHLLSLSNLYDMVWASGWEERADDHLPHLLGLPKGLPFLRLPKGVRGTRTNNAHWKLEAIEAFAGERPLAWIDDSLEAGCHEWARQRPVPTLLVQTAPEHGLTLSEARELERWALELAADSAAA